MADKPDGVNSSIENGDFEALKLFSEVFFKARCDSVLVNYVKPYISGRVDVIIELERSKNKDGTAKYDVEMC